MLRHTFIICFFLLCSFFVSGCATKQLKIDIERLKEQVTSCEYNNTALAQQKAALELENAALKKPEFVEYVENWKNAFFEIAVDIRKALAAYDHDINIRNGMMYVSIPTASFFEHGSALVSSRGTRISEKLTAVFEDLQSRDIWITVRSVDSIRMDVEIDVEADVTSNQLAGFNRELSSQRALEIARLFTDRGINPINIVTGGYGIDPNEETLEDENVVDFVIHPLDDEILDYPLPPETAPKVIGTSAVKSSNASMESPLSDKKQTVEGTKSSEESDEKENASKDLDIPLKKETPKKADVASKEDASKTLRDSKRENDSKKDDAPPKEAPKDSQKEKSDDDELSLGE